MTVPGEWFLEKNGRLTYIPLPGEKIDFIGKALKAWQATGKDVHSVIAVPFFTNPYAGDYHIARLCNVRKTAFIPFDYTKAGVYGNALWKKKAQLLPEVIKELEKLF